MKRLPLPRKVLRYFRITIIVLAGLESGALSALEARDGHFYEGNDRVRLWGVHLSPGLSVSPYEVSDALISRIRFMGFNAVGIWGVWEMFVDGIPQSRKGDNSPMDRLDYLIYKCREAGLYVWLAAATRMPRAKRDDYIIGPANSDDAIRWYEAVQGVQTPKPDSRMSQYALYLDKNLQQLKLRFITDLLNHTNPYTETRYKDHSSLLLYLADENSFISAAAGKARRPAKDASYFDRLLQTKMDRLGGGIQSVFAIADQWHDTLLSRIKTLSPQMLANVDTTDRARLFDLFSCTHADFCAYGVGGHQGPGPDSMLYAPPRFNDGVNRSREFKIKGKPWIMYTGNPVAPAEFRAEWPLRVAAFASYQDADGVFFWNWALGFPDNENYMTVPVYDPKRSTDISADEILLSSSRLAGLIFLHGYIPPARKPITFTFGHKAMIDWQFGYDWYDTNEFKSVQSAAYTSGAIIEFDLSRDIEFAQDRSLDQEKNNPLVWNSQDGQRTVLWDWQKGQLIVDTPEAKAFVGFVEGETTFNDGISLSDISRNFISFALVAEDGQPIGTSGSLLASLVSESHNTGFERGHNGRVLQAGSTPVVVKRVAAELSLPHRLLDISKFDFAGNVFALKHLSNGRLIFREDEPTFAVELHSLNTPLH